MSTPHPTPTPAREIRDPKYAAYWQANIRIMAVLLVIWFAVSFGAGILFADALDNIRFFGFKLGFFFAQQGAIYVFVVLIFYYTWRMNRLEREYDVDEE
jgi:putative solute:sodium symporter small subunit